MFSNSSIHSVFVAVLISCALLFYLFLSSSSLHSCSIQCSILVFPFQNENRMALISALDETSSLFTGTGKISTLGSLHRGESLVSDVSASLSKSVEKNFLSKKDISVGRRLSWGSVNILLPVRQHWRGGYFYFCSTDNITVLFS